ncbi:MAG: shikimate dehydrogenase [bacterium]
MDTVSRYGQQLWVIGSPISHTLSPPIHNAAFEAADLPHRYFALEVERDELEMFLSVFRELNALGANLTLPLKQAVREHVDTESESVTRTGAANTLYWDEDGDLSLENTDVYGFKQLVTPFRDRMKSDPVLLLGAGGAARSCLQGFKEMGVTEVLLWNRTQRKANALAERFSELPVQVLTDDGLHSGSFEAGLVVNSTSLGLEDDDPSPIPVDVISEGMYGVDLIYGRETRFQGAFSEKGDGSTGGLTMLIKQAARAWQLWTGQRPNESAMEAAAQEAGSE